MKAAGSLVNSGLKECGEGPELGDRGVAGKTVVDQPQALFTIQVPPVQLGKQLFSICSFEEHRNPFLFRKVHLKKSEPIRLQDRHGPAALAGMPALVPGNEPGVFLHLLMICRQRLEGGAGIPVHLDRAALYTDRGVVFLIDLGKNVDPGVWVDEVHACLPGVGHTHTAGAPVALHTFCHKLMYSGWTTYRTDRGALARVDLRETVPWLPFRSFPAGFAHMQPVPYEPLHAARLL